MVSDNWFESWFDSYLYEKLYAYRDDSEAKRLVKWITTRFPPERFTKTLDMGCGRGRHAIFLAQNGYHVTGVDLSSQAIGKARQKAENENVSGVTFEVGDMRIWRGGPFDLVCNLFTSFGYFENDVDNINVAQNMIDNLDERGFLVMDYLNQKYVRRNLVPEETLEIEGMTCHITREIRKDMVVKTLSFSPGDSEKEHQFQERVKMYDEEWFRSMFRGLGLTGFSFFGDYDGERFDPDRSPRLLMVVERDQGVI